MNIKQLEAFVRIVKNKSFSQTAKELYLNQQLGGRPRGAAFYENH